MTDAGWLWNSSVPGMMVPGMAQPGNDGQSTQGAYQYIGQLACFYLDYLDVATGRTLAPVPGNYYTMVVASGRAGLTVPPPGRPWNPGNAGAGGTFAALFLKRAVPPEISHGHYPGATCGHCDPGAPRRLLPPRRMPGPDFALQDYAAGLAQARAHNAARLATLAAQPPAPQPQGTPQDATVPARPPPSEYQMALAAGRAHNAARLARIARGETVGS